MKLFLLSYSFLFFCPAAHAAGIDLASFDRNALKLALILVVGIFIYYLLVWLFTRCRPQEAIGQHNPPQGMSALETYWFESEGKINHVKTFKVLVTSLAAKGAIRVEEDGKYILRLQSRTAPLLAPEEKEALSKIFTGTDRCDFLTVSPALYNDVFEGIKSYMAEKYAGIFKSNFVYNIPVFAVLVYYIFAFFNTSPLASVFFTVFMGLMFYALRIPGVFLGIVFGFIAACIAAFYANPSIFPFAMLFFAAFLLTTVFMDSLRAYNEKSASVKGMLIGFKAYLSAKEPNTLGVNLFCDFLPYAIAFDAETAWVNQFKPGIFAAEGKGILSGRGLAYFSDGEAFGTEKLIVKF